MSSVPEYSDACGVVVPPPNRHRRRSDNSCGTRIPCPGPHARTHADARPIFMRKVRMFAGGLAAVASQPAGRTYVVRRKAAE